MLQKLPLLPNGKLDRKHLPAPELSSLPHGAYVSPRDVVELQLVQMWEELLSAHPVGIHDNFFELGGHSLKAIQMSARIKQQFERTAPIAFFLQNPTVAMLAAALREQEKGTRTSRSALIKMKEGNGRPPLFFVHPVGGNVLCYAGLGRYLDADQPFYGLQSPADERLATIESMATHYLSCVREVQPKAPYYIGGWSLGGAVAFEMARQLEASGVHAQVFLVDAQAPGAHLVMDLDDRALMAQFVSDLENLSGKRAGISFESAEGLSTERALKLIVDHLREHQIVPFEFSAQELLSIFNIFSNNLRAFAAYKPGSCGCQVNLIRSSASAKSAHSALGWKELTTGQFEVNEIEGDHYSIVTGSQVTTLAALLEEKLARGSQPAVAAAQHR